MNNYTKRNVEINDEMNDIMSHLFGSMSKMTNKARSKTNRTMDGFTNVFQSTIVPPSMFADMDDVLFMQMQPPHRQNVECEKENSSNSIEDIHIEHSITFKESYNGCCIPIVVERLVEKGKKSINECETIYVDIPKGIDHNEIITLKEKGHTKNDKTSDLKLHIVLEKHDKFERKGMDLVLKHNITFKESILGFSFVIEHLNGNSIKFKNSKNKVITNKASKVIEKLGFIRGENQGDLVLEFYVSMPETFSEEQLKMIEEYF